MSFGSMFIFSNLATSLDGKIAPVDRDDFPLGTPEDREQMQRLRRESDAILFGASTLRAFKSFCHTRALAPGQVEPMNIVLSSKLEGISPKLPFFTDSGVKRVLFVSEGLSEKKLAPFRKSSEIQVLKKGTPKNPLILQLLNSLEKMGVKRLLVEGGGTVMALFAEHDLIDEYHVTLTPRILGGAAAPTMVDGKGLPALKSLKLKLEQCRAVGDELYLVYRSRRASVEYRRASVETYI